MTELAEDFLRQLFVEVDEEVAERVGEHLLVVGGAALIFAGMPRGTEDIDLISRLSSEPLIRAISTVGKRHELRSDWLNDAIAGISFLDLSICGRHLVFEGRNIQIFRPDLTYILALKLRSAREKDRGDVLWLMDEVDVKAEGDLLGLVGRSFPGMPIPEYVRAFVKTVAEVLGE